MHYIDLPLAIWGMGFVALLILCERVYHAFYPRRRAHRRSDEQAFKRATDWLVTYKFEGEYARAVVNAETADVACMLLEREADARGYAITHVRAIPAPPVLTSTREAHSARR